MGGVDIEGLLEHVVRNTDGVMSLLREGAQLRTTAASRMNKVYDTCCKTSRSIFE